MGLVLTTTFALGLWIVLWATGIKAFDGFLLAVMIVLLAVVVRAGLKLVPGSQKD